MEEKAARRDAKRSFGAKRTELVSRSAVAATKVKYSTRLQLLVL